MNKLISLCGLTTDYVFQTICLSGNVHLAIWFGKEIEDYDNCYLRQNPSIFEECAKLGHFKMVKWLHPLFEDALNEDEGYMYRCIVKSKSFRIRRWLIEVSNFAPALKKRCCQLYTKSNLIEFLCRPKNFKLGKCFLKKYPETRENLFLNACKVGNLSLVKLTYPNMETNKYLASPKLQRNEDEEMEIRNNNLVQAFKLAAMYGQIEVCQWLYNFHPGSDFKIHEDEEYIFRSVCANGYLITAKWLLETFPDIDITNYLFELCVRNGKLKVIKWLRENIDHKHVSRYFTEVCEKGYLRMAKWIWEETKKCNETHSSLFSDTLTYQVCSIDCYLIRHAFIKSCRNGHTHLAKWLCKLYVGMGDHPDVLRCAFHDACLGGHINTAKWLYGTFKDKFELDQGTLPALAGKQDDISSWIQSLNMTVSKEEGIEKLRDWVRPGKL